VRKFIDMIACKVGPIMAMRECRPDKEKRQEQRKLKVEERERARGRAELAKLIASSNGRLQLVDTQGRPINVKNLNAAAELRCQGQGTIRFRCDG
jgi:hypothetical protein